jgi:CheY-like chemotaxis protein
MILLIEDDLVTCQIMGALLKRMRLPYQVAHSGAEAWEVVRRHPIDLLLLDLGLPDGDGIDLVEQMLLRPHLQDIPTVVCTANASRGTVERALGIGVVDFVKKPINVDSFAQRLQRALKRAPVRWEPWPQVIRRLRVDTRTFMPLLMLARDELASLVGALQPLVTAGTAPDETTTQQLLARVARVRSAALNVGAVRAVQLIDFLWTDRPRPEDLHDLHEALVIELGAIEHAIHTRGVGRAEAVGA